MASGRKRLMVLGAGPFQLAGIVKAAALGVEVITADYLPDNIGHRHSHRSVDVSTTDWRGVLDAARALEIDGITTFASDVAMPTVARVARELGLPGADPDAVARLSNKASFRRFQAQAGRPHPGFAAGQEADALWPRLAELSVPVVVKPVDTSGSRGVARLDRADRAAFEQAFDAARAFSVSHTVCVEEFVTGADVSGDAFMQDGRLAFAAVTRKHKIGFVPTGHSLPTTIGAADIEAVRREIELTCQAAGYLDGPFNFDVMVEHGRATVIEMSPRTGGNGIPELIEIATGFDILSATARLALAEPPTPRPDPAAALRPCGSYVFGAPRAGRLLALADRDTLRARVPEVFAYTARARVGDEVSAFDHGGNCLGYVLFHCPPGTPYEALATRIDAALAVQVGPPDAAPATAPESG